jgi:predicted GNAT family acetyltransferase
MKLSYGKFFLIIYFSTVGIAAANEWRLIAKTETAQFFIETTALSHSGNEKLIKIKRNEIQGDRSPASLELTYLINCSENTVSLMAAKQFKELDFQGDGKSVSVSNPPSIVEAKQGTTAASFVKAACQKLPQQANKSQMTNSQIAQQDAKLKDLLRNTWGWNDATIQMSINTETQNIRKQNPSFNDDQVKNAVYDLWAKRAKEITNPEIIEVKVPNAVQLATVLPKDPDFVFPIANISTCGKHCLNLNDYRKTCSLVKNLTYQAAMMSTVGGLDARLLERRGAISDVLFKWENNQCVMQYVVTGVFSGKKEGCRVFGLVTAFAVGEPGGIVANRSYPIGNHPNSTCRLY